MAGDLLFSLMCPLGAQLFVLGIKHFAGAQNLVVGYLLASEVFLRIDLNESLPEIEFHSRDRFLLSAKLVSGMILAYLIGFLEPARLHDKPATPSAPANGDGHEHDHSHDHRAQALTSRNWSPISLFFRLLTTQFIQLQLGSFDQVLLCLRSQRQIVLDNLNLIQALFDGVVPVCLRHFGATASRGVCEQEQNEQICK